MSSAVGRHAEDVATEYLHRQGYGIVHRNWRTRWCEIDIVAVKEQVVYFVEVKYRSSNSYGRGLEYITLKKLRQMRFAAEFWLATNSMPGLIEHEYCLSAMEVAGPAYEITVWIDEL